MYSVRLGYSTAKARINRLLKNGHKAEALVASVATVEKTFRRVLLQTVVSAGFTREDADKLVKQIRGFDGIKQQWNLFDPCNRKLVDIVGNQRIVDNLVVSQNDLYEFP